MAKKCIVCGNAFVPKFSSFEKSCQNDDCRVSYSLSVLAKQKTEKQKKIAREWKEEKKVIKEKIMTLSDWQKLLEKPINKICCLIDFGSTCISCNGKTTPQAGHYHTVGSNKSIRFNLDNLHLQDYHCNCEKSGNIHQYDLGLIKRYGKEYWEYVKFDIVGKYPLLKIPKEEYQHKISIANSIVKWLQLQNKNYSPIERLQLRKKYNKEIGIYL